MCCGRFEGIAVQLSIFFRCGYGMVIIQKKSLTH